MRKLITFSLYILLLFSSIAAYAASPMGLWQTIDDVTGRPKGIVRISGSPNNLTGTVVKVLPGAQTICTACTGKMRNKPITGMTVMWGLRQESNSNKWSGGTIFDPKNGKTYRCALTVSPDGRRLEVRGYVGISLLGRSQTWVRVK